MSIDLDIMGERIREIRKKRHMTAEELSAKLGIAVESLDHIECGNRKPSLPTLYSIAEILDVSLDYLTGRSPSQEVKLVRDEAITATLTPAQEAALQKMVKALIPTIKELV